MFYNLYYFPSIEHEPGGKKNVGSSYYNWIDLIMTDRKTNILIVLLDA